MLANRLSGQPKTPSVCLIERGPSHTDSRWSVAMAAGSYNQNYERDLWLRYYGKPENNLNGRKIDCSVGTRWGGTNAVNYQLFVRGQSQDFDR